MRKLEKDLWEVRVHLDGRIARVLFTVSSGKIVLLHGFIKKTRKTPLDEIELARRRMKEMTA